MRVYEALPLHKQEFIEWAVSKGALKDRLIKAINKYGIEEVFKLTGHWILCENCPFHYTENCYPSCDLAWHNALLFKIDDIKTEEQQSNGEH